jgi:demethylmenaquinone methyltransferase/2-methoxy-6-polyprenyl-1,4-benzoquinol methylase
MANVNYNRVAKVYEALGYIYAGRRIYDAKASQMDEIRPGDRVLYAGVGPGEDAVLGARRGARVTCVDVSAGMLRQAQSRFEHDSQCAEFLNCDVLDHDRQNHYDVVIVNFFLNVFAEDDMQRMLRHLATLTRFGGKVLISDFMPPEGNLVSRSAQRVYWGVTNLFYCLLSLSAWHPVYDYPAYFASAGLSLERVRRFRLLSKSPL